MTNVQPEKKDWREAPEPIGEEQIVKTIDCDVAVVGAGIAGVTCACRASQLGLSVVVLEKTGNWNARGGNIGVPNSSFMRSQGKENDLEQIAREWIKRCGSRCDETVVWRYLHNGERAMDWLLGIVTAPEYGCRPELQACLYNGETYREIFGSHRFFDGPMAKKGMRPGAADAVYAMYCESLKNGAQYIFRAPACQLEKTDGAVTAVLAETEEGIIRVRAKRGVVLATGDISGNEQMCEDLAPLANRCGVKMYSPKGVNTGDGHRMGVWAGGILEDTPFPMMLHPQAYHFANYCFLFVDQKGRRFMNEDNYIQGKCNAMLRRNLGWAWSILDGRWAETIPDSLKYGSGIFWGMDHGPNEPGFTEEGTEKMLEMGMRRGVVVRADTPEELAEKMNVPADAFVKTLREYNELCHSGKDTRFGKRPELLVSLETPPYYGLKFGPAVLTIVGGLLVDDRMNVLDKDREEIPGLYAVGNAAGGRYGVDYPMIIPGNSHGTSMTLSFVLAELLAGKDVP